MEDKEKNEKELKKKAAKKRRKRGFLIFLNAVLACYLIYCVYDTGVEFYRRNILEKNGDIISIDGRSETKSLEIYNKVIDKDEYGNFLTTNAIDFSFYAGYLSFKEDTAYEKDSALNISSYNTYTLNNLTEVMNDGMNQTRNPIESDNKYINHSVFLYDDDLKEGDYIIYPHEYNYSQADKKQRPIKIESQNGIYKTYYSPLIKGKRRKIEIKSKSSSPALIVSITNIFIPEHEYHDVAFLYQKDDEKEKLNELFSDEKFSKKFISKNTTEQQDIISLYEAKANVSIIVDSRVENILISHYIKTELESIENDKLSEGNPYLKVFDENTYIRELGGNVFNSGSGLPCEDNSTKWLHGYKESYDAGSFTVLINPKILDIKENNPLQKLLNEIVNFNFI